MCVKYTQLYIIIVSNIIDYGDFYMNEVSNELSNETDSRVIKNIVSVQHASRLLGMSRTQVYRLMEDRCLKEIIVGDKKMVGKDSVERYAELKKKAKMIEIEMKRPII
jgi:hypothetical protein